MSSSPRPTPCSPTRRPQRLSESGAREVVVTNTLPIAADKRFPQLTVLSIAPLIARAIREVFDDGSVTSLFDGRRLSAASSGRRPARFSVTGRAAGNLVRNLGEGERGKPVCSVLGKPDWVSVIDWV